MNDRDQIISGEEFKEYLSQRTGIDREAFPPTSVWAGSGDTFGAIALKMNLINMSTIDIIMEAQTKEGLRFGELAVRLGMISEEQAQGIVALQRFHRSLETGERLVVNGQLKLPDLLRVLADFLEVKEEA